FEWDVGVSSKASRGDRFYFAVDTPTGVNVLRDSYTTLPDATLGRRCISFAGVKVHGCAASTVRSPNGPVSHGNGATTTRRTSPGPTRSTRRSRRPMQVCTASSTP